MRNSKRTDDSQEEQRTTRKRTRRNKKTRSGIPPLSLWECGIGAVWK